MMKIPAEKEAHYGWKVFFVILLTAWIVILDMNPAFVVSRVFFDVSPKSTDQRVMLYGTNGAFDHPDLRSVMPSVEGWKKADMSHEWAYLKQAYGAETQVLFRYTNSEDIPVYVSVMRTDSERKLVHGLQYCYELQGYSLISRSIVKIEPSEGIILPINLWFLQRPESAEGWIQTFWYIVTYREGTVEKAYFTQVQAYVPTPGIKEETMQIALSFTRQITVTLLKSLISSFEV